MRALRFVDLTVPGLRRTPRELLIIGVAAATAIDSWRRHGSGDVGNLVAFAAVAVGFATRFFATRVFATAVVVAAAALHATYAWRSGGAPHELLSIAYFLGAALVLGGRALVAAFDDAPARGRWPHRLTRLRVRPEPGPEAIVGPHRLTRLRVRPEPGPEAIVGPNFWRELSTADRRHLAVLVHGVAITLAMLYYVRFHLIAAHQPVPPWLPAGIAGMALVGLLLLAGRAIAALIATVAGGALAAVLLAHAPVAWSMVSGEYVQVSAPAAARVAPHLLIGAAVATTLIVAAAAPWAWRLLRLSLGRR